MSGTDVKEDITYSFDNSKTYHTTSNTINDISRIARNLGYGRHTLTAICKDDTLQQDFVIFSPKEEIPAVETEDWAYQSSEVFPDKGKVYIQVGTSEKDYVRILYHPDKKQGSGRRTYQYRRKTDM